MTNAVPNTPSADASPISAATPAGWYGQATPAPSAAAAIATRKTVKANHEPCSLRSARRLAFHAAASCLLCGPRSRPRLPSASNAPPSAPATPPVYVPPAAGPSSGPHRYDGALPSGSRHHDGVPPGSGGACTAGGASGTALATRVAPPGPAPGAGRSPAASSLRRCCDQ